MPAKDGRIRRAEITRKIAPRVICAHLLSCRSFRPEAGSAQSKPNISGFVARDTRQKWRACSSGHHRHVVQDSRKKNRPKCAILGNKYGQARRKLGDSAEFAASLVDICAKLQTPRVVDVASDHTYKAPPVYVSNSRDHKSAPDQTDGGYGSSTAAPTGSSFEQKTRRGAAWMLYAGGLRPKLSEPVRLTWRRRNGSRTKQ